MPTAFQLAVYHIVKSIPPGKVATYKQVAELAGSPKASRAVGMCMKHNPDSTTVPCHRVVASNGKLTGYAFGGIEAKKKRLQNEGALLIGDRVDLTRCLWKP
jgi:methylated-DNA-protein-cysteine methyltransferase related protein